MYRFGLKINQEKTKQKHFDGAAEKVNAILDW